MAEKKTKLTVPDLIKKKQNGERVVMVAAADFLMAQWAEPVSYTHLTLPTNA